MVFIVSAITKTNEQLFAMSALLHGSGFDSDEKVEILRESNMTVLRQSLLV